MMYAVYPCGAAEICGSRNGRIVDHLSSQPNLEFQWFSAIIQTNAGMEPISSL